MLSASRGGAQGGGRNGQDLSSPSRGEGHKSYTGSQHGACKVGFLFQSCSRQVLFWSPRGTFPRKGMPRASGQCWLSYQASLALKIHALGLGWRNPSSVGSWGDW